MKTLDQRRATHAWGVVTAAKALAADDRKEFGTQAKKLPTRIMAAGLGQSLALLAGKEYAPALVGGLRDWLAIRRPAADPSMPLYRRVFEGDADFLRFATAESLAYLQWLVRFADAEGLTDKATASDPTATGV